MFWKFETLWELWDECAVLSLLSCYLSVRLRHERPPPKGRMLNNLITSVEKCENVPEGGYITT